MAKTGVTRTRMLLLSSWRGPNPVQRYMSAWANSDLRANQRRESINGCEKQNIPSYWVPHQRTGIYFPEGHDWVMDDVPDAAASFDQTYWIRTVDGVDKPDQDHDADYYSLTSPRNNA
ncbi:ATP synthase subunit beta like [Actinidia chinensis var. chinensis]|uniref:ATP synthase subunit beta like n=1 Tax=Actinidia chinensis var. chinensis TaxID=1590841 RepID=A0A2R6RGX1_ACTCC|nr:ATP synthase subunit beta like [Actinidia chinensis var. chinensis]